MYQALEDKLIEITERHAAELSEMWCNALRMNPRTPSYHAQVQDYCVTHAMEFYKNLRKIYYSEKPYTEVTEFFSRYAELAFQSGIPLQEAIYALIMMRRQIWLYADIQAIFVTPMEHHQAVASITKTIRIFDHGIYAVIKRYEELKAEKT
ncbi:MAG TPA: hypothetical protein PK425_06645 [Syntrophales bacterium]|jgi:hypothetical protein|nr:hypothetical protein [Syntrophales bacterium]HPX56201.1 hypothetical protein [Syntrophales bacterium]HQA81952.1 hypothetical protein [Syntrophales bacterium]